MFIKLGKLIAKVQSSREAIFLQPKLAITEQISLIFLQARDLNIDTGAICK